MNHYNDKLMGYVIEKQIDKIDNQIRELEHKISELKEEKSKLTEDDNTIKVDTTKIYRITDNLDDVYIGKLLKVYYSECDNGFIVETTGINKEVKVDYAYFVFMSYRHFLLKSYHSLIEFFNNLEEVSAEEFDEYLNGWLSESEVNIRKWFSVNE